ncbi:MAG: hypothetical protein D6690_03795 [Nitrospirae bacterium]|nr:MAG: hypothetical protein D6690_03795 [Nitrospirota bacterium]
MNPQKVFLQNKTARGLVSAVWLLLLIVTQSHATSFQVQMESDTDRAGGNEVFYLTYNSSGTC